MYSWGTNKEQIYPITELQLNRTIHSGVTEIFRSLKFMSKLSNSPSPTVIFPAPQKFTSAIGILQDILRNTHHWLFRWVQLLASPVVRSRRRRPTIRIRLRYTGPRPRTNRNGRTASSWPDRSGRPQDGGQPLRSAPAKRGRIGIYTADLQKSKSVNSEAVQKSLWGFNIQALLWSDWFLESNTEPEKDTTICKTHFKAQLFPLLKTVCSANVVQL